ANAYQGFSTFESDVRIVTGSKVDVTKSVDQTNDIVYGQVSTLPQTVSIVEDRRRTVTISRAGSGSATVAPSVAALDFDCGSGCYAFLAGTPVTFTVTPTNGSTFTGWAGACNGTTLTCAMTTPAIARDALVATYTVNALRVTPPPPPPPAPKPTPPPAPAPSAPSGGGGGGGGSTSSGGDNSPAPSVPSGPPVPFKPMSLQWKVTGSTVTLKWAAPAAGPVPTAYVVEAGSCPGLADLAQVPNGLALSLVAPGVGDGIYYVRVRGANANGVGVPSDEVAVVVGQPASAPACAQGLSVSVNGSTVALGWSPVPGATTYVIEAGSTSGLSNLANISTGSTSPQFIAGGVPAGVYYVRVRAVTASGVSRPSNEVVVVVR
ncbi:MAG TPA: fibronectin type III domain-containing protein, partial [Vicinamibacterales bacterium]|nr:fibronectin type III domain-containing protein [Vicinamibacterales bacterium]